MNCFRRLTIAALEGDGVHLGIGDLGAGRIAEGQFAPEQTL